MPSITEDFNQSEDLEVFVDAEEDLPVSVEELQVGQVSLVTWSCSTMSDLSFLRNRLPML